MNEQFTAFVSPSGASSFSPVASAPGTDLAQRSMI
jgi:hypothetical protein